MVLPVLEGPPCLTWATRNHCYFLQEKNFRLKKRWIGGCISILSTYAMTFIAKSCSLTPVGCFDENYLLFMFDYVCSVLNKSHGMTSIGLRLHGDFMGNGCERLYYQKYKLTFSRNIHLFNFKINFNYNTVATLQWIRFSTWSMVRLVLL